MQLLLYPDPRPLVDQLGPDFFRTVPTCPGVYLMRDAAGGVLYVGKARNLRRRLAYYRVANPDRLRPRHLRLLRAVARIELQTCPDESSALARESALLRTLRPRFNRAGTWPSTRRFLAWRTTAAGLELSLRTAIAPGVSFHGPLGAGAAPLRLALVRLLWSALQPQRSLPELPAGWSRGRLPATVTIPRPASGEDLAHAAARLTALFAGQSAGFAAWIEACASGQRSRFELAVRTADLEVVAHAVARARTEAVSTEGDEEGSGDAREAQEHEHLHDDPVHHHAPLPIVGERENQTQAAQDQELGAGFEPGGHCREGV